MFILTNEWVVAKGPNHTNYLTVNGCQSKAGLLLTTDVEAAAAHAVPIIKLSRSTPATLFSYSAIQLYAMPLPGSCITSAQH